MDLGLAGRGALITGAARGIGKAEADALAAEGVAVAINDIDEAAALETVEAYRRAGITAIACIGDVSDPADAARVVDAAAAGLGRLDILVNNAGAGWRHMGKLTEEMAVEDWDKIIDTHLRSSFLCTKFAIPHMRRAGFGRIVNTSSINYTGGGRSGVVNYTAAKAGIAGFTRNVAKEVGPHGITVNAIAPGYVETALTERFSDARRRIITGQNPVGRYCRLDEIGALVAYLCSNQAAFINGTLVPLDGGRNDFWWDGN
ncbi:SDR family NAD(P)-dependent oxidoreductase [Piscinibacter sakaiensis]|uniref:3-oxoacyl-ACP reductase n=1 Tax=Piscinibacter sakaiensis TaxID=1547922 RepID=A0A0K8NZN8_PISS1|nr:SDR family NAD(P)-dependent oxidoreductase [Piscinibacter sakaiensis]GAP35395.1 3-oxoacyl-ACP reductase [Piscinibacter sakaiensis]